MLTASEIVVQIGRGEIAWPGELRGDGLLLRLGSPLQPLADPGMSSTWPARTASTVSTLTGLRLGRVRAAAGLYVSCCFQGTHLVLGIVLAHAEDVAGDLDRAVVEIGTHKAPRDRRDDRVVLRNSHPDSSGAAL